MGVSVRAGALATSSKRLWSAGLAGGSMTTGTLVYPASLQSRKRLNPSITS